jgi:hypothetical protein
MRQLKKFIQEIGVMSLSIAIAFVLVMGMAIAKGWKEPTQSPPNGNIPAPINVGDVDQIKTGGLSVDEFSAYGNALFKKDLMMDGGGIFRIGPSNLSWIDLPSGKATITPATEDITGLSVFSTNNNYTSDLVRISSMAKGDSSEYNLLRLQNKKVAQFMQDKFVVTGDGKVGIGTVSTSSPLTIADIPEYADELTAIAAGLTSGSVYRNGDNLKIVTTDTGYYIKTLSDVNHPNCVEVCNYYNLDCVNVGNNATADNGQFYEFNSNSYCGVSGCDEAKCNMRNVSSGNDCWDRSPVTFGNSVTCDGFFNNFLMMCEGYNTYGCSAVNKCKCQRR